MYKQILQDALADVKQELLIIIDGNEYLVYIQGIVYTESGISVDWSTPHDDISRDVLFEHVKSAIEIQLKELICQQQQKQSYQILSRIRHISGKYIHLLIPIILTAAVALYLI
ncbi:MAG: hypothetical protein ACRC3J_09105 [Culicoidibacterales bacterium]